MKSKITLLLFLLLFIVIKIQAQIPNGGFENWTTFTGYETPSGIWTCFNNASNGSFYAITKSTDAHTGNYALKISNSYPCNLSSEPYKFGAVFTTSKGTYSLPLSPTTMFDPSIERSGHPIGLNGYYKFTQGGSGTDIDTMRILVSLYKIGQEVASVQFKNTATVPNWTQFTIDFPTYLDSEVDSIGIVINACQPWDGVKGNSSVLVDDFEFKYSSTGFKEAEKSNPKYIIYPNPVSSSFKVNSLIGSANISIIDFTGKLLFSKNIIANENIDISILKTGIYIINIQTSDGVQSVELIKK